MTTMTIKIMMSGGGGGSSSSGGSGRDGGCNTSES